MTKELAGHQAAQSDKRIAAGRALPLDGIPISVKDIFCTAGVKTTAASRILSNFVPTYEFTVTKRLLDAGAVFVGKTNMDEFAMGSSTESSYFGPTLNPVAERLGLHGKAPGGSSGGAAASVAANQCLAALGTDTGGSVRQPAAFCGVVGFKPTYGLCSRWGIIAYASSLDQAGVLAKNVDDVAAVLDVIVAKDDMDSTSVEWPGEPFALIKERPVSPLTVGYPAQFKELASNRDQELVWERALASLQELGAKIVPVSMPTIRYALPAYYVIALAEASSNLARYDGVRYGHRAETFKDLTDMYERTRAEGFGAEVKRRIMLGTYTLSAGYYDAYYKKAQQVRRVIANEFDSVFKQVDCLIWPTTPTAAFDIGQKREDPTEMYLEDVFTVPVNLAYLPAMSLPIGTNDIGLPLGLTLCGNRFGDFKILSVARQLESLIKKNYK